MSNAPAQISANGEQLQVNTYTTSRQANPAVASSASGSFVVVWESQGSNGSDTSSYSIQARRYGANGIPLGAQFQVNSYTTSRQGSAAVAVAPQGNFVVAWASLGSSGSDTSGSSIQGQRFDSNGAVLGTQFQVNTHTTNGQFDPAVAVDALGRFFVVWHSEVSPGSDASGWSVQARRFDASGVPLDPEIQVNTFTTNHQYEAAVAADALGNLVVVWTSWGSSDSDTSFRSVHGQRYAADGSPLGAEFQVNTYTTGYQYHPAVAVFEDEGNFLIVWESDGSIGSDTSLSSIQARIYFANGAPFGGDFQVNSYTTSNQARPALAANLLGHLVVAWSSIGSSGTDTSQSIQARRHVPASAGFSSEFQVNSYTTSSQAGPAVATNTEGDFVIVWESWGSNGTDTNSSSIQAQRYDSLFRDGFESGGLGRWSSAVP